MSEPAQEEKTEASVVYVPGPHDPVETTWRGVRFVKGVPVVITDKDMIAAAKTNPHFNVDGEDKAADAADRADKARQAQEDAAVGVLEADFAAMEERHERERADLEAKQHGEVEAFKRRADAANPKAKPEPKGK